MTAVAQQRLDGAGPDRRTWAVYDPTKAYRYKLGREWDRKKPRLAFIMLNPSTATEYEDDPTIRRCIDFGRSWGFGSLEVGNLFAFRATDPKVMKAAAEPVGAGNDLALKEIHMDASLTIAAWGANGKHRGRASVVREMLERHHDLHGLRMLSCDEPQHPLYLSKKMVPLPLRFMGGRPAEIDAEEGSP